MWCALIGTTDIGVPENVCVPIISVGTDEDVYVRVRCERITTSTTTTTIALGIDVVTTTEDPLGGNDLSASASDGSNDAVVW